MIKASLRHHSPEAIYNFLNENVGPLYMLVKNGYAIINFEDPTHTREAFARYKNYSFEGILLSLTKYTQGELDTVPLGNSPGMGSVSIQQQSQSETLPLPPSLPEPTDEIAKLIYRKKKDIIEFILDYNVILDECNARVKEIQGDTLDEAQIKKQRKELASFVNKKLEDVFNGLKNNIKRISQMIRFKGKKQVIDLNPQFGPGSVSMEIQDIESSPIPAPVSFEFLQQRIEYVNRGHSAIKRMITLNDNEFACTEKSGDSEGGGKVNFYQKDQQNEKYTIQIPDGPYGLLKIDDYILVGNQQGKINYINLLHIEDPPEQTKKMHDAPIFDIVTVFQNKYGTYSKFITRSEKSVKCWKLQKQEVCQGVYALDFQEDQSVNIKLQTPIFTIQSLGEKSILVGSFDNIFIYDIKTHTMDQCIKIKQNVSKIKKLNDDIILSGNLGSMSQIDMRSKQVVREYPTEKEVKSIQVVTDNLIFYGSDKQVGMVDRRREKITWKNDKVHKGKVCDIVKVGDMIISGDSKGVISGWKGR